MRRSFDKLAQGTRELLGEEPQSGALYVFVSKTTTRVKVLWWDRNGYCIRKRWRGCSRERKEIARGEAQNALTADRDWL
jgi:hypothetical protein